MLVRHNKPMKFLISNFKFLKPAFLSKKGFTLVELLVSSAIFTVVSIVAVGAVLTINAANRKTQAIRAVVDNLNFAMESMSRKLRTGSNYHCAISGDTFYSSTGFSAPPADVSEGECGQPKDGASAMMFTSAENITANNNVGIQGSSVAYGRVAQVSGCQLTTPVCRGKIQVAYFGKEPVDMTPPEVDIQDLHFYVQGKGGGRQPRVLISIAGLITLKKEKIDTPFNIQTTVTQRLR